MPRRPDLTHPAWGQARARLPSVYAIVYAIVYVIVNVIVVEAVIDEFPLSVPVIVSVYVPGAALVEAGLPPDPQPESAPARVPSVSRQASTRTPRRLRPAAHASSRPENASAPRTGLHGETGGWFTAVWFADDGLADDGLANDMARTLTNARVALPPAAADDTLLQLADEVYTVNAVVTGLLPLTGVFVMV